MHKFLLGLAAIIILASQSLSGQAKAAPIAPLNNSYSPVEKVACWCGPYRCACRRAWRRGPYYGGYAYRPYGYYGYGYRPYYGYGWRPGITIGIGPGWRWGY